MRVFAIQHAGRARFPQRPKHIRDVVARQGRIQIEYRVSHELDRSAITREIILTDAERTELEGRARRYTSPYSGVVRAKIVLYAAEGLGNDEIAARLDTPRQVVSKWRKRFHEQRLPGLADQPRGGRPPSFSP